jgi:hypothetical protein
MHGDGDFPTDVKPEQDSAIVPECGVKSAYGLYIALIGLVISFCIAVIMIIFGMRTAGDLVAVIAAFTGITGTLAGYFFGEKAGSAGKMNAEKQLSKSRDDLLSAGNENAVNKGSLEACLKENRLLGCYLKTGQRKIDESIRFIEPLTQAARRQPVVFSSGVLKESAGNAEAAELNKALSSLKEARIPDEILEMLEGRVGDEVDDLS